VGRFKKLTPWLLIVTAGAASFYGTLVWRGAEPAPLSGLVKLAKSDTARAAATAPGPDLERRLERPERTHVIPLPNGDAFAKLTWLPPPPPVLAPAPQALAPVVPQAPPLPFTFVGLLEQGATRTQAFLAKGDALLVVAEGDMLDSNTYRVESVSAQQIVVMYLPLSTPQTITLLGPSK